MQKQDNQPTGTRETAAARRQQALDLRKAGASYRAIGARLNISEAQAHRDVKAALSRLAELELASAEELRTMELMRLDMALLALAPKMKLGDPQVVGAWVRISESRRRLLGLDAPAKVAPVNPDGTPYETQQHLIGLVLRVLAPYPDLRLAIAAQLDELNDADILDHSDDGA